MSILNHHDLENILLDVRELKLSGLTARKIAAGLDKMGYKTPLSHTGWQTHHVLKLIEELRRREMLPQKEEKVKAQYRRPAQKPACHFPED